MDKNIQNNSISDNKKFWLITAIYLFVFWILPLLGIFYFVDIIERLGRSMGIIQTSVGTFFVYFLLFVPIIIVIFFEIMRFFNIKYKKVIFILIFILFPYLIIFTPFLYALTHITFSGFL